MILNMISGPRNISTALMYSFAQHRDFEVVDEPYYAYYLKETGLKHPGREEVLRTMKTNEEEITALLSPQSKPHLFIKNMAHHLILVKNRNSLKSMKNLFLIRDPAKLIYSFSKVIPEPTLQDIGVRDEYELFEEISRYQKPVIIDSDEVLKDPAHMLSAALELLGFTFDQNMLNWNKGPIEEDGIWAKYWYKNVHNSSGFAPYEEINLNLEGYLLELYEEALPYYKKLSQHVIKSNYAPKIQSKE